jgi:serine/threonine-protein kinase RsbW
MGHQIRVTCEKANLKKVRAFVKACLASTPLPEATADLVVVAVDEVCANLMIHNHQCNPSQHIEVRILPQASAVAIEIVDQGALFEMQAYQPPSLETLISHQRPGGLGLILVLRIMDAIEVRQEDGTNIYCLIKHYPE